MTTRMTRPKAINLRLPIQWAKQAKWQDPAFYPEGMQIAVVNHGSTTYRIIRFGDCTLQYKDRVLTTAEEFRRIFKTDRALWAYVRRQPDAWRDGPSFDIEIEVDGLATTQADYESYSTVNDAIDAITHRISFPEN